MSNQPVHDENGQRLFTTAEAARELGCNISYVYMLIADGKLITVGRRPYLIPSEGIAQLVAKKMETGALSHRGPRQMPPLERLLREMMPIVKAIAAHLHVEVHDE